MEEKTKKITTTEFKVEEDDKEKKRKKFFIILIIEAIIAVIFAILLVILIGLNRGDSVDYKKLNNRILDIVNKRIEDDEFGNKADSLISVIYHSQDNMTYITARNDVDVYILKHTNEAGSDYEKSFTELLNLDTTYIDNADVVKGELNKLAIKNEVTRFDFTAEFLSDNYSFKNVYHQDTNIINMEVAYGNDYGFKIDLDKNNQYFDINLKIVNG